MKTLKLRDLENIAGGCSFRIHAQLPLSQLPLVQKQLQQYSNNPTQFNATQFLQSLSTAGIDPTQTKMDVEVHC